MNYLKLISSSIFISLLISSQVVICQNKKPILLDTSQYEKAARTLGNYLLEVQDIKTKSWSTVWNPNAIDAITSFYAIGSLNRLSNVINEKKYKEAAEQSLHWWIDNMFLDNKEKCGKWIWSFDNKVDSIKGWEKGEWEKCEGALISQYYPEKDGFKEVHVGSINARDGATLGIDLIKKFSNNEKILLLLKKWFVSDLENKSPKSGNSKYRGFMTVQSLTDSNHDGYLEISPAYSLWGGRHQASLVNAQMILDLRELGMKTQVEERAEWLIHVVKNTITGNFYETFDVDKKLPSVGYKSNFTFGNGQVVEGLLVAYELCRKKIYLTSALEALDWLIKNQAYIDNKLVYFTEDKVYRTFTAVPALCKAYKLTGNKNYLIYAMATCDWIISQMKLPFNGFEDKNAWTVAEGLEALVSVCELKSK